MSLKFEKVVGNMNHGMDYGMNVVDALHKELNSVIGDFAQGHAATQNTIQNFSKGFQELRAYMHQQSMMIQQLQ